MKYFKTIHGEPICVELIANTDNYVEILVRNLNFYKCLRKIQKQFVITVLSHIGLLVFLKAVQINLIFIPIEIYLLYSIFSLVNFINITVIRDLAIQMSTKYCLNREENLMVSISSIKDVVINEVILHLQVIHIMIIITNGKLQRAKPIIPILDKIRPNLKCLQFIYKEIQHKMH